MQLLMDLISQKEVGHGRVLITTLVNFLHYHKPKRWRWQLIILDCEQRVIIWDAIDLKNWQHDLKIA